MSASRDDIRGWLMQGKLQGATHMIVACDTFDWTDYPVYVQPNERAEDRVRDFDEKNMQRVMEVYDLSMPFHTQLQEYRAWHVD